MKLNYRADIDGLRAIAVLSVVLNHAGVGLFSGGFVGVDVFFVISGYLITSIIMREIDGREFSLVKFYERRIRRIYPALFAMMLLIVCVSAMLYDAENFRDFGKSMIAATFFASNIHFWFETGYFEAPAQLKPLLHTWSLAVEEQYYIIFPALMYILARRFKTKIPHILTGIALLSFGWSVYELKNDPSGVFYFAHLRAWELLIGSILALAAARIKISLTLRNLLSAIGFGMVVMPIFFYTSNTAFPGMAAAIPALGAALVIYGGIEGDVFVGKILSLAPLVFIGQISYSLYLWHWPVIIFGKYYAIRRTTTQEVIILLLITFIVSVLSWQFIEKPFRSKTFLKGRGIFVGAGSVMLLATVVGSIVYFNEGFPARQNQQRLIYETKVYEKCNFNYRKPALFSVCALGEKKQTPSFLFWGDSHALSLGKSVHLSALKNGATGQMAYAIGCPPLLYSTDNGDPNCFNFNHATIQYIKDHPELNTVILASRWAIWAERTYYDFDLGKSIRHEDELLNPKDVNANLVLFETGFNQTVKKLIELNRKVVIVTQTPEIGYDVPSAYFIAQRTGRDVNEIIAPSLADYFFRNRHVFPIINSIEKKNHVQIIDPWKVLCDDHKCFAAVNGMPLYKDSNHLSVFGAEYISPIFDPLFEELAKNGK